jgi:hypothetical protein
MIELGERVRLMAPPARFGETRYAHAVAQGDPAWLATVDAFVAAVQADGTVARAAARHELTSVMLLRGPVTCYPSLDPPGERLPPLFGRRGPCAADRIHQALPAQP